MTNPEWITAICAAITLAVYITANVAGAAVFILRSLKDFKKEILADVNSKHSDNNARFISIEQRINNIPRNGRAHVHR